MYDLLIVGAGPAGITAAIYAVRQNMNVVVITQDIGGQAALSTDVENYTGYQFVSGPELAEKFEEHLKKFAIELKMPEKVVSILKQDDFFTVKTESSSYTAKTVIISSGKRPRLLNIPGEKEFKNKGVTYCAVCDGPLFSGQDVAIIGGGNSALDATMQMKKIAKKVYLITINPELYGEKVLINKIAKAENVEVLYQAETRQIVGNTFVEGVSVKKDKKILTVPVTGVFVEIGWTPSSSFVDLPEKNSAGEIIVNCACETSIPGLFAAGDVTNVPEKQIIVAAGEGAKAALAAMRYLSLNIKDNY